VSFTFGSIASPTDFVAQFNEDVFNVPVASAASSVDVSPRWSELGLNYPANTDTAVSSSVASPAWSEVGLTYQANVNASTAAVNAHLEQISPPPSPFLYHDVPAPPASLLFDSLLTVARDELHALQHESLNLLTNVAAHTADFDALLANTPFIEEIENIPPPISAVLPARSPSPEYIVRSPTPPLRYPSPIVAAAVQPPPANDEVIQVNFDLFPHLFATPPCVEATQRHPHLYTVVHRNGQHIWCPQEEFVSKDFLANIPRVHHLDHLSPHFVTPFRALVYHEVLIRAIHTLPPVTLCAKVGRHPASLHLPFGFLESSFVDSLKFLFGQFPPDWLTYFEGALVPLVSYDFLDGRLITVLGYLHFSDEGLFVTNHHTRIEDVLRTKPELAQFACTPRTPENPLLYVTPPREDLPL